MVGTGLLVVGTGTVGTRLLAVVAAGLRGGGGGPLDAGTAVDDAAGPGAVADAR